MIYGIGTDIVRIDRIERLIGQWGDRFARRVLGPEELAEYHRRRGRGQHGPGYSARYLAKRFAAKEAFGKALGTGVRAPATLPAIAVGHDTLGKPVFAYSDELAALMNEKRLTAHLSISDEHDFAVAFVVLEQA